MHARPATTTMFNRELTLISYPLSSLSFVLLGFCNSDVLLKSAAGTFRSRETVMTHRVRAEKPGAWLRPNTSQVLFYPPKRSPPQKLHDPPEPDTASALRSVSRHVQPCPTESTDTMGESRCRASIRAGTFCVGPWRGSWRVRRLLQLQLAT